MPTSRTNLGNHGEDLARRLLEGQGYTVLQTNYRCRWGEIDIVAQDGNELVFVEVRTRSSDEYGTPAESVTEAKAQRLVATAQDYMQNNALENGEWRIDLVSVRMVGRGERPQIDHLKHAIHQL